MWLLIWILFVVVLLAIPVGYGWGYRGWGPPYPRYYNRRGRPTGAPAEAGIAYEDDDWGVLGDILWVIAAVAVVWLLLGLLF